LDPIKFPVRSKQKCYRDLFIASVIARHAASSVFFARLVARLFPRSPFSRDVFLSPSPALKALFQSRSDPRKLGRACPLKKLPRRFFSERKFAQRRRCCPSSRRQGQGRTGERFPFRDRARSSPPADAAETGCEVLISAKSVLLSPAPFLSPAAVVHVDSSPPATR